MMRAVLLAGGLGTRLRGVVPDLPKPLAPVAGRPFLEWVLDALEAAGFGQAVLAVGYRGEAIRERFGSRHGGLELDYSVESQPLGTGGAIRLALERAGEGDAFVLNGDTFVELDYEAMLAAHRARGARITMAVCEVPDAARYGALRIEEGVVTGFREKGAGGPGPINAGAYVLSPGIREFFPPRAAFSFETDVLMPRVAELRPRACAAPGLFIDIGVPEDYARAQAVFATRGARSN